MFRRNVRSGQQNARQTGKEKVYRNEQGSHPSGLTKFHNFTRFSRCTLIFPGRVGTLNEFRVRNIPEFESKSLARFKLIYTLSDGNKIWKTCMAYLHCRIPTRIPIRIQALNPDGYIVLYRNSSNCFHCMGLEIRFQSKSGSPIITTVPISWGRISVPGSGSEFRVQQCK